jgi:hypothetical protein
MKLTIVFLVYGSIPLRIRNPSSKLASMALSSVATSRWLLPPSRFPSHTRTRWKLMRLRFVDCQRSEACLRDNMCLPSQSVKRQRDKVSK